MLVNLWKIWVASGGAKVDVSLDFYHVACFEEIADLPKADFLDRISPMTRSTCRIRNLKGTSILDGNYLCEGKKVDSLEETLPEFNDLLQRPGSSKFTASGPIPG